MVEVLRRVDEEIHQPVVSECLADALLARVGTRVESGAMIDGIEFPTLTRREPLESESSVVPRARHCSEALEVWRNVVARLAGKTEEEIARLGFANVCAGMRMLQLHLQYSEPGMFESVEQVRLQFFTDSGLLLWQLLDRCAHALCKPDDTQPDSFGERGQRAMLRRLQEPRKRSAWPDRRPRPR
jgi:hypothetical protein